jgi:hypothetical protein
VVVRNLSESMRGNPFLDLFRVMKDIHFDPDSGRSLLEDSLLWAQTPTRRLGLDEVQGTGWEQDETVRETGDDGHDLDAHTAGLLDQFGQPSLDR